MSFQYKNKCFETALELHSAIAADCPLVMGNIYGITCTATAADVTFNGWLNGVNVVQTIVPVQNPCAVPTLQPVTDLAWLVVGVWAAAWAIRKMMTMLPGGR